MSQFVTTVISRKTCSIDSISKNVKKSDFLSIVYSKPLWEYRIPKNRITDRVRISKFDLPLRKGYKPQFTEAVFKILAISSGKPPTYTINDEQGEIIRGNFHQTNDQSHLMME